MSWSINLIGKPDNMVAALGTVGEKLEGESKAEFEEARPALITLVQQNFAKGEGYLEPVLHLQASGHGYVREDRQIQRTLTVKLEPSYAVLV